MHELQSVANYHCVIGENPLYNERDGKIYWEDIPNGRLFRADHETLAHECFYQGGVIGGFTFQDDDSILLFQENQIARLDRDGKRTLLNENVDPAMERFNDVIADPEGRVFAGSYGRTDQSAGLYRVDLDGTVTLLFRGSGCSNGMGFTPDLKQFYWTCSTRRRIFIYDYERKTGALSNERLFYQAPPEEAIPDGMTVDTEGFIWTTRWDGSLLLKLSPEGKVLETIRFPVKKVSSCAFGGPNFDTLYVTTAGGKGPSATEGVEGTLFRLSVGARGKPEFRSRIRLT